MILHFLAGCPKPTTGAIVLSGYLGTVASGINNNDEIVGTYFDSAYNAHGFVLTNLLTTPTYETVDVPNGMGTTHIEGVNDKGNW